LRSNTVATTVATGAARFVARRFRASHTINLHGSRALERALHWDKVDP
jgi:hypothetical protein